MKNAAQVESKSGKPQPVFLPPLKPRPKLFYALLVAFAIWVAAMLVLYFTTVHSKK